MNTDITNKADITLLVEAFYQTVMEDDLLKGIFIKAKFDLETHIPVMVSFWQTVLLHENQYHGNPMIKHIELNQLVPLKGEHFSRWLQIWENTIHKNFNGPVADDAVKRASTIAQIMQNKISLYQQGS
ncbi:MAG: group III truncated hemoglobin [Bacteroidota bacterium]